MLSITLTYIMKRSYNSNIQSLFTDTDQSRCPLSITAVSSGNSCNVYYIFKIRKLKIFKHTWGCAIRHSDIYHETELCIQLEYSIALFCICIRTFHDVYCPLGIGNSCNVHMSTAYSKAESWKYSQLLGEQFRRSKTEMHCIRICICILSLVPGTGKWALEHSEISRLMRLFE